MSDRVAELAVAGGHDAFPELVLGLPNASCRVSDMALRWPSLALQ